MFLTTLVLLFYVTFYLMVRSSQKHSDYIRSNVGSKVVKLINENKLSGGTGFFVEAPSKVIYLMTNAHVCGTDGQTSIFYEVNKQLVKLKIIEVSTFTDLCLVEAPKSITEGLELASDLTPGEEISVVGHPKLMPLTETKGQFIDYIDVFMGKPGPCQSETENHQTALDRFGVFCVTKFRAGATTVPALGGNSGSPVVNWKGDVVGVLFAGDPSDNWGLIISMGDIKTFLSVY